MSNQPDYEAQAARLEQLTSMHVREISSPTLTPEPTEILVWPSDAGGNDAAFVVGIRLFHAPREVVVDSICTDIHQCASRFDAAAYSLETPMLPLDRPPDENYRGEVLRFIAVDWGCISITSPLRIYAKPWGCPAVPPKLEGYLVLQLARTT